MNLFYAPAIHTEQVLPEEESAHALRVLRLQAGSTIEVVDGAGGFYKAVITNPHPKHCTFEIVDKIEDYGKRDYKLHIAIAPTKNIERYEWFIEKAVEMGIDEITPLLCRYSERKIIKPERLEKIIVSAAKQSIKAFFPKLNTMCSFDDFINTKQTAQCFIAHCYDEEKQLLQNQYHKSSDVIILIGPEGDFSPEEVQNAIAKGYKPVSLGSSRLRTETAGLAACHTVVMMNE